MRSWLRGAVLFAGALGALHLYLVEESLREAPRPADFAADFTASANAGLLRVSRADAAALEKLLESADQDAGEDADAASDALDRNGAGAPDAAPRALFRRRRLLACTSSLARIAGRLCSGKPRLYKIRRRASASAVRSPDLCTAATLCKGPSLRKSAPRTLTPIWASGYFRQLRRDRS
mmetsp:Transcript_23084/g.80072  ORF Transcript_23084/g.80072 Transcript_23084/m.80072 type:complete len:178 (-) Transcript_23084:83-616(-)